MKYIYIKGLLNRKKFITFLFIIILLITSISFLMFYKNEINTRMEESTRRIENITLTFQANNFNINNYLDLIDTYSQSDNIYSVTFNSPIDKETFIETNNEQIVILDTIISLASMELEILKILNLASIILLILLFIILVVFTINYTFSNKKEIFLYDVLGFTMDKTIFNINLFFSIIYFLYILIIFFLVYITTNKMINDLFWIAFVLLISNVFANKISKKIMIKK